MKAMVQTYGPFPNERILCTIGSLTLGRYDSFIGIPVTIKQYIVGAVAGIGLIEGEERPMVIT